MWASYTGTCVYLSWSDNIGTKGNSRMTEDKILTIINSGQLVLALVLVSITLMVFMSRQTNQPSKKATK